MTSRQEISKELEYHQQVSDRAYQIWIKRGKNPNDEPDQNWYEAKKQLQDEYMQTKQTFSSTHSK